jgi:hypothetical protein
MTSTVRHKASGLRVTRSQVMRYVALTPGARAEFLDDVRGYRAEGVDWNDNLLFEVSIAGLEQDKIR